MFDDLTEDSVFNRLPLATVLVDSRRRVVAGNVAFERLFGYSQADLREATLDSLLAPVGSPRPLEELTTDPFVVRTTLRRRQDDSVLEVEVRSMPMQDDGSEACLCCVYTEPSHRSDTDTELRRSEARMAGS